MRRVEARVEHGVKREAVGLTAIEGVGEGRAESLSAGGLTTPADVVAAGAARPPPAGGSAGGGGPVAGCRAALPTAVAAAGTVGTAALLWRSFRKRRGIRAQPQFTRQNLREREGSVGEGIGAMGFGDVAVNEGEQVDARPEED